MGTKRGTAEDESERNVYINIDAKIAKILWLSLSLQIKFAKTNTIMKHKVKVTVIDKKLYPELQQQYCADPNSGMCPCYNVGDEFIFERIDDKWFS